MENGMKDVKPIIAENLAALRKSRGLTQAELAERLDYSDKAVSRWEHGVSQS
jgi:transcriptional regulator, XRE family